MQSREALGPGVGVVGRRFGVAQSKRVEIELLLQVGVAPFLEPGRRQRRALVDVPGVGAALLQPLGLACGNEGDRGAVQRVGDAFHEAGIVHGV
jgi:hypothetical protein